MASKTDLLKEFDPLGLPSGDGAPGTAPPTKEVTHQAGDATEGSHDRNQQTGPVHPNVTHSEADTMLPKSSELPLPEESVKVHQDSVAVVHEGVTVPPEGISAPQDGIASAPLQSAAADVPVPSPSSSGPTSAEKKRRSHKHKKRSVRDRDKGNTVSAQSSAPSNPTPVGLSSGAPPTPMAPPPSAPAPDLNLAQTQLEMLQIDSILQALSSGNLDGSSLAAISKLTSQPKAPPSVPPAATGTSIGLQLISQLQSGEEEESSSTDTDSEESTDDEDDVPLAAVVDDNEEEEEEKGQGRKYGYPTVKGEVDYRDLTPAEKRNIPFPEGAELAPIGKVSHVTEKLVVVEALPGAAPVNEGTIVWSQQKECLGEIFETFGPVKNPFYSLLVSSEQELSPALSPGQLIYVVPDDQTLTRFVFAAELMKQKGCDASWKGDIEVPVELQEHSDDEAEMKSKKKDKDDKPKKKDRVQKTSSVVYTSDPLMKAYFQGPSGPLPPQMMPPLQYSYHHPPPPPPQGYPQYPAHQPHQSPLTYSQTNPTPYPAGPTSYYPGVPYFGISPYPVLQRPANYSPHFQAPPQGYQAPPQGYQAPPHGYRPQW